MNLRWLSILMISIGMLCHAACGGDGDPALPGPDAPVNQPDAPPPPPDAPPDAPPEFGRLRIIHAAPVAAPLDVYVQGQAAPIAAAIAYGAASAAVSLAPGAYRLEVRDAGAPATAPALYTSEPIDVARDRATTAVAAGLLGSTAPATQFRITGLADAFGAATPGKARVRVVHDSYSLQSVALDIGDDGALEVESLDRFAATDAAGLEIAAGSDAAFAVLGTDAAHTRQGAFVVPAALLADGAEVYAVITGLSSVRPRDPRGLVVVFVPVTGAAAVTVRQNPIVYLLAASPDAAAIDAYGGATKLFDNLAFGKLALRRLPPTTTGYTLDIRPAGADPASAALASLATGPLEAGEQYLAVVHGLVAPGAPADALALHVYRDELQLAADGNGRLRAVHAALGVAAIDVGRYTPGASPMYVDVAGFAAIAPAGATAAAGTAILDGTTAVPINPGVRAAAEPGGTSLRFTSGSLMNTDRFIGVFAGAWTPVGAQVPPRFIVVKTAVTTWTTVTLSPQATPALRRALVRTEKRARRP